MDFRIATIKWGEGPWTPEGGDIPIRPYNGDPLYVHANSDGGSGVTILIDENPLSSSFATGTVSRIEVQYTPKDVGAKLQTMRFRNPGVTYNGGPLFIHLLLLEQEDKGDVVLVVDEQPKTSPKMTEQQTPELVATAAADAASSPPTAPDRKGKIGLVTVGTGVGPDSVTRGYFVNVPIQHTANASSSRVNFPPGLSIAGPIGSVNLP